MLSNRKYGFKNESDIISYLDGKHFSELDEKWQKHIRIMHPFVEDEDLIIAKHYDDPKGKPDMVVTIRHTNVYVSIKTGRNSSIHQESFKSFSYYLKSLGVSDRTLKIMEFYQFGETKKLNNDGMPYTRDEMIQNFSQYFLEASQELDNIQILEAVIRRAVIKGAVQKRYKINYLYYGNIETGFLLSEEDIYRLILNYREHGKCPIHFGSLNCVPQTRDKNSHEYGDVRIKWPILALLYYRSESDLKDIIAGKLKV